jgi:hypothetical protein
MRMRQLGGSTADHVGVKPGRVFFSMVARASHLPTCCLARAKLRMCQWKWLIESPVYMPVIGSSNYISAITHNSLPDACTASLARSQPSVVLIMLMSLRTFSC